MKARLKAARETLYKVGDGIGWLRDRLTRGPFLWLLALLFISIPLPVPTGERIGIVEAGQRCVAGEVSALNEIGIDGLPIWGCVPSRVR